jgi:hypothetical protein
MAAPDGRRCVALSNELAQSVLSNKDTGREGTASSLQYGNNVKHQTAPFCQDVRPRCPCWKPSVRAPKVRSCFEFAGDLRDVAPLKARARKFVL